MARFMSDKPLCKKMALQVGCQTVWFWAGTNIDLES
jgi:hypothetical protein